MCDLATDLIFVNKLCDAPGVHAVHSQREIAQIVDWFWRNCTVSAPAKSDMHDQD